MRDSETRLIIFAGLPGTGKTFVAEALAESLHALRLSRDEIRSRLFNPPTYTDEEKSFAFSEMLAIAENHLKSERDVIMEGMPFSRRAERDAARSLAESAGAQFILYHCVCPDELAIVRIESQTSSHPAADREESLFWRVKSRFQPIEDDECAIVLDTEFQISYSLSEW